MDKIGLLDDLEPLFDSLLIPLAVAREIAPTVRVPSWIVERPLAQPVDPRLHAASLGQGEKEAIALALELGTRVLLIDELPGRRFAKRLGVPVTGTLGLLLTAKQEGIIADVAPILQRLLATGFFTSPVLIDQVLARAGESRGGRS